MMYSAETIAEYVIYYCDKKGKIMTNLKLQKILYFIQVNFLVTIDNPCFKEDIFAWGFGPVIPEVYRKYKAYGSTHIPVLQNKLNGIYISEKDKPWIDEIIDDCCEYSGHQLTQITLNQWPWIYAYYVSPTHIISHKSLLRYFKEEDNRESNK